MAQLLPALALTSAFWLGGSLLMGYAEAKKRDNPYWLGTIGLGLVVSGGAGIASVVGGTLLGDAGMVIAFPLWIGLVAGGVLAGGFWFAPLLARRVSNPSAFILQH